MRISTVLVVLIRYSRLCLHRTSRTTLVHRASHARLLAGARTAVRGRPPPPFRRPRTCEDVRRQVRRTRFQQPWRPYLSRNVTGQPDTFVWYLGRAGTNGSFIVQAAGPHTCACGNSAIHMTLTTWLEVQIAGVSWNSHSIDSLTSRCADPLRLKALDPYKWRSCRR